MEKKILELIIFIIAVVLLLIAVYVFSLEKTVVVTLALLISKIMATEILSENHW